MTTKKKLEANAQEIVKLSKALNRAAPWPETQDTILGHIVALGRDRLRIIGFSEDEIVAIATLQDDDEKLAAVAAREARHNQ
jgi:hypothetical protein